MGFRREALLVFGACLTAILCLVLSALQPARAEFSACQARVELSEGGPQTLKSVAHCVLKKRYPYLIGQEGKDVVVLPLRRIRRLARLDQEAKGDMIGLLLFEVETNGGTKHTLGLNGSTNLVGQGPGGEVRLPFARIRKITFTCP